MARFLRTFLALLGAALLSLIFLLPGTGVRSAYADGNTQTFPATVLDGPTWFAKQISSGVWMYRDSSQVIHVRMTNSTQYCPPAGRTYTGTLKTDSAGSINVLAVYKNEKNDSVTITGGKELTFSFDTHCAIDGFDFSASFTSLTVTFMVDGVSASPMTALGSNPFGFVQSPTFILTQ